MNQSNKFDISISTHYVDVTGDTLNLPHLYLATQLESGQDGISPTSLHQITRICGYHMALFA